MKQKNIETILYSTAGVAAMFVVLLAFYVVTSAVQGRALDLTAEKAFTLSAGHAQHPGQAGFARHPPLLLQPGGDHAARTQPYAQEIEDLLGEYQQAGKGKIVLEKFDPKPDSDAEDSARLDGVARPATSPFGGDKVYLGLVGQPAGPKSGHSPGWTCCAIRRERLLEYDISRAISPRGQSRPRHHRRDERPARLRRGRPIP